MKIYNRYFALSLLIFSSALSHAALQNGKFEVSIIKGQSSLINPQSIKEPMVKGKLFEQGYKVETNKDSTVELSLSNGSTVLLNPETIIEIKTFRQVPSDLIVVGAYQKLDKEPSPSVVEILVTQGKIIGEVRKLNPQSSFTIKSPAGVARIRGTVYSVQYSKNRSNNTGNMEVACVKGSVEVTINGSDSGPSKVEPGKKIIAVAPLADGAEDRQPIPAEPVKVSLSTPVVDSPTVSLPSTEGLVAGADFKSDGIPDGVKVVNIADGKVTLSAPVTLAAGAQIVFNPPPGATLPVNVALPSAITNPVLTVSKLGADEVKALSSDLGNGTSLPTQLKDEVKEIADKTPPSTPTTPKNGDNKNGTASEPTTPDATTETNNPPTNAGGATTTGGASSVNSVMDAINNTIQQTVERENQKNPSPTQ